jgi:quinol monooxygenase YgiN
MARFGTIGRLVAHPGRREELVELLVAGTEGSNGMDGCELYLVSRSADEPDTVWVVEVWRDQAAHRASLENPQVRAVIERGRPLIAAIDGVRVEPVGGLGLS